MANVFTGYFDRVETRAVTDWFDAGNSLQLADTAPAAEVVKQGRRVKGMPELLQHAGVDADSPAPLVASAIDFVLEGLYSVKKIARSEERGYHGTEPTPLRRPTRAPEPMFDEGVPGQGKKKYYN